MDFGLPLWKHSPGNFNFLFCKMGWTSPPSGVMTREITWWTIKVSPRYNLCPSLSPALLASLAFIFKSLQVPALTSVFPLLPGPVEDKCQELMCKCDLEIAYCLAKTEYNLKYLLYPRFLCGKDSPKCDWLAWLEMSFLHKEIKLFCRSTALFSSLQEEAGANC